MSDENTNARAIIEVAKEAKHANDRVITLMGVPLTIDAQGSLTVRSDILAEAERIQEQPTRRTGSSTITDLESFIAWVIRYRQKATTIWADVKRTCFQAVINDHPESLLPTDAGWGDFGATYTCPLAPEWEAWRGSEGLWLEQEQFADWLDSRMEDLTGGDKMPDPVDVLEMARNLQVHTKGTFQKKVDPTTGQYSMVCKEEHTAESTRIYRSFMTALRIFEGGEQWATEIRIQFRLEKGRPQFRFEVHRADEMIAEAFSAMRKDIATRTERPVFAGSR